MKYQELRDIFQKANKEYRVVVGLIVFTKDSFDEELTQSERTFKVSSVSDRFNPLVGGRSVFGTPVCEPGKTVQLDCYMADENGGPDGWKVETCGILKYHLIRSDENGIEDDCEVLDNEKAAMAAVRRALAGKLNCREGEVERFIKENGLDADLSGTDAWVDYGDRYTNWNAFPVFLEEI